MTPTDIEIAVAHDCRVLKYFPAATSGGLANLKVMAAPFAHLGLRFIPLGGIDANSLREYIESPLVLSVGGSWLAGHEAIRCKDWDSIRTSALESSRIVQSSRRRKDTTP
jgi:2-dehydro-3-deoxyphosphogluconate aldolase/(4S)-4-hydroxy-2-oxoglutarate aldolase